MPHGTQRGTVEVLPVHDDVDDYGTDGGLPERDHTPP